MARSAKARGPYTVLVLAATRAELASTVRALGLRPRGPWHEGFVFEKRVVAGISGVGADRSVQTAQRGIAEFRPDMLVSLGFAGGLVPLLPRYAIAEYSWVTDGRDEALNLRGSIPIAHREADRPPDELSLLTHARFIDTVAWKRQLARQHVHAVDMETLHLGKLALQHRLTFRVARIVLDPWNVAIRNDMVSLVRPDGFTDRAAVAGALLRRPWRLGSLLALGHESRRAAKDLASEMLGVLSDEERAFDVVRFRFIHPVA